MTNLDRARMALIVAVKRWALAQEQDMRTRHLCDDWLLEANRKLIAAESKAIRRAKR